MKGTHDDELPQRFDDDVILEIEDGSDRERPLVRMTDRLEDAAWVSASIDAVISLSECR